MNQIVRFVLALLLIYSYSHAQEAQVLQPKSELQYWKETGLKYKHFKKNVLPHCYDSERHLMACLDVLNALSASTTFATETERDLGILGQQVRVNKKTGLHEYELYQPQFSEGSKGNLELWNFQRRSQEIHRKMIQELFAGVKDGTLRKVNFKKLVRKGKNELIKDEKDVESYLTNLMFNTYLETAVDPHTRIVPEEQYQYQISHVDEEVFGIGVNVREGPFGFLVVEVIQGSPAMRAGLKAMDQIIVVNGLDLSDPEQRKNPKAEITGPIDTEIDLKIRRKGAEFTVTVTRSRIVEKNVQVRMVSEVGVHYGHIQIRTFQDPELYEDLKKEMEKIAPYVKGWILDLRFNTGGYLHEAVLVASLFVGGKLVTTLKDIEDPSKSVEHSAYKYMNSVRTCEDDDPQYCIPVINPFTYLPTVVLINGWSASASEIVAAALQDHHRAWVVGQRSYGKGSAQKAFAFEFGNYGPNDKIRYIKTTNRFYRPSGLTTQNYGVIPNFVVDAFPGAQEEDRVYFREEDQYRYALASDGAPWKEDRSSEVEKINQCRATEEHLPAVIEHYRAIMGSEPVNLPDYQLMVAQDILSCAH